MLGGVSLEKDVSCEGEGVLLSATEYVYERVMAVASWRVGKWRYCLDRRGRLAQGRDLDCVSFL